MLEGDYIKRLAFALTFVIILGIFAGCGKTPDVAITPENSSPFSIYRREDGQIIKIGDKREDIEELLGPDEMLIMELEEYDVERVQYYDNEDVWVDYTAEGFVSAMRIKTDEWKIFNNLAPGGNLADVKNNYPEEYIHKYEQSEDLWISYDESGSFTKFSTETPYVLRFASKGGKTIDQITIQDNRQYVAS